jgi:hypothetical protein
MSPSSKSGGKIYNNIFKTRAIAVKQETLCLAKTMDIEITRLGNNPDFQANMNGRKIRLAEALMMWNLSSGIR